LSSGIILATFAVSFAFSSVPPCISDADCIPNAQCVLSNISGSRRCITSDSLIDPIPAGSPLLDQACSSNSNCPSGYRCAGLATGHCAADLSSFCNVDADCKSGACVGSCLASASCTTDSDCPGGSCSSLNNATGAGLCISQAVCNGSSPCPKGFLCTFQPKSGRCELSPTKCDSDSDCMSNWHCHLSWATAGVITGECLPN
jgi:hypothetical protein